MKFSLSSLVLFFCSVLLYSPVLHSAYPPSVWEILRNQFRLNHEISQPQVQAQIRWLVRHPNYLQNLSQAKPYIYHIIKEVKQKGLPGELALLPMIESAFNPFAYSGVGAAGLWQLMPGTGSDLGLKRDWWFDARRSIHSSTQAALKFLSSLNRAFHGNWILAIAAYDAGEGAVTRAIKNGGQAIEQANFWSLPLPNETKAYIPRLLALAEIIEFPQKYNLSLPYIPYEPYFEEVNVGSQIDLNHAAKLAGISYRELITLNPGYNHWTTAPNQPFKLLIPASKVLSFRQNLATDPSEKRVSWTKHYVRQGDSLSSIAQLYFTTPKLLRELNQLVNDKLQLGQSLLIPSSKNTESKKIAPIELDKPTSVSLYKVIHIVQPGDSYPLLEKKYQVDAKTIQIWNAIPSTQALKPGLQLIIWKRVVQYGCYTIKPGDTLSSIAKSNNTQVESLIKLNPVLKKTKLKPGLRIILGT